MLFDTDILIWYYRNYDKAIAFLSREKRRRISQVTWMELVKGAKNKRDLELIKSRIPYLGIEILPLTSNIGERAVLFMETHVLRDGLDIADALIAATAVEYDMPLATANVKHFRHLAGLRLHAFKP